jgi:hypothetical protein
MRLEVIGIYAAVICRRDLSVFCKVICPRVVAIVPTAQQYLLTG